MTLPSSSRYDSKKDAAFAILIWSSVLLSGIASVLAGLEELAALLVSGSVWIGSYRSVQHAICFRRHR